MSTLLSEDLPDVLKSVRTRPMFVMRLDVPGLKQSDSVRSKRKTIAIINCNHDLIRSPPSLRG
jgi:hypothetical protein